jgi:hypothetical protein
VLGVRQHSWPGQARAGWQDDRRDHRVLPSCR